MLEPSWLCYIGGFQIQIKMYFPMIYQHNFILLVDFMKFQEHSFRPKAFSLSAWQLFVPKLCSAQVFYLLAFAAIFSNFLSEARHILIYMWSTLHKKIETTIVNMKLEISKTSPLLAHIQTIFHPVKGCE